jgi:hypothetical protein
MYRLYLVALVSSVIGNIIRNKKNNRIFQSFAISPYKIH